MPRAFVSEPLEPVRESFDAARATPGAPILPGRFRWRGREYAVSDVLAAGKTTGACTHGSDEKYVRTHNWRLRADTGEVFEIYCERRPRGRAGARRRWWIYTVEEPA